jgi:DNA-binding CsgD family transcriptional regulator
VALRRGAGNGAGNGAGDGAGNGAGPGDHGHLDAAWELAERLDEPLARLPVLSALAEREWLLGGSAPHDLRLDSAAATIEELASLPGLAWAVGDLAVWLSRLGTRLPTTVGAEPFRLELGGRSSEAAGSWERLGAPFEKWLALVSSTDAEVAPRAVEALDAMGAAATADRCRALLRQRGLTRVPMRPRASTRANPAGLTNRQFDVARLVARGLTNAELAADLFISPKTADHHVSAVLAKLGLETRRDVIRRAAELGLD